MEAVVEKRMSFDSPPKPYWVVVERVTPQGHTIDLPGIYSTEAGATKALAEVSTPRL